MPWWPIVNAMEPRRLAELLLAVLLVLPAAAQAQGSGRTIYCCEDDAGRPVCGDVLPGACYGKAYREISPQGTVRRHVAAPLTPEEVARRQAEERRRKLEETRALQQRRLDQALLETYASLNDLDDRRDRALAEVERSLIDLRERLEVLDARHQKLLEEKEFYRDREVPRDLADDLRNVEGEIAAQRSVIDAKNREAGAIRARFEEDRRRYVELTRNAAPDKR